MSVLSTGSNMNQFDYDKFGIIEGGKEMDAQFAFPYVHKALSAAQHALGQVQVGIVEYTISQGDDRKIKEQLGCAFYNMSDVQEGFAAIKQAIPELDSSEDLNAATKGVEEFDTCLTQISAQVAEIASQWLRVDPGGNESINEKLDMVKGYQKDLMRVHTQILYSKEIKQVRIGNLKDTIENTSSRTDSIILRWITKLSFVKAVLRKLFGWGAASPSIQQLEKHFKICKESLEGLKLASFDLHNKTELNRLVKSVETAKENLNEFSNYIYNIEGEEKKVKEFNSLIKEAKGEVDGLLTKLNQFKDDFGDQTFVDRMNSIHGEAQSFSPSSKAKSAASIISLCEQAMDQHQMNIDDDSFEEVLPMVVWAQGVLEKSLELGADQTTSAIKHSREEYLFLSMCLQGADEILSKIKKDEPLKEGSQGLIEQPVNKNIPEAISQEELAGVERNIAALIAETRKTMSRIDSKDDIKLYKTISGDVKKALKEYKKYNELQQYRSLDKLMTDIRDLGNLLNH